MNQRVLSGVMLLLFAGGAEAQQFAPVDTSKLIGSPDPIPLEVEVAFPNLKFKRPVELTYPPDESTRLFVVEQQGVVRLFKNRRDVAESQVFLDIREQVSRKGNEEGLLGLAFHPKYRQNGYFFVYYSTSQPQASVVSRFQVSDDDPDRVDPNSERLLMKIDQPFSNHNGGSIKFGPDGYLYIGLGDGGLAHDPHGNGQDLSTLLGSILRIDVDRRDKPLNYAIPADNPFVDLEEARPEIFAYGLRNVWRLHFDRATGDLWCGDVGQERYEEINRVTRGGNYGWKIREGRHPFAPDAPQTGKKLIDPVAEHYHSEGESITGGIVYRGDHLADWQGRYFFGDYESGFVWALTKKEDQWHKDKVAETGLDIAAFGADRHGEMYLCAFDGKIYRLVSRELHEPQQAAPFPRTLAETQLFKSVAEHRMAPGIIPYSVNIPFWSDGALKQRFIALPKGQSVTFHQRQKWEFPLGTVFIKTFLLPLDQTVPHAELDKPDDYRRLETRLFVHGRDGWAGYTYMWNDAQTEAHLIDDAVRKEYEVETAQGRKMQTWHFPNRQQCMACHSKAEKFVLGWTSRQLNRKFDYSSIGTANQIDTFKELGFFREEPPASTRLESFPLWRTSRTENERPGPDADLSRFSRAWLDVNCRMCHQPEGIAGRVAGAPIDLRFHIPLAETGIVGRKPGQGQLSPQGSSVLSPSKPGRSELLWRIDTRDGGERQMPPLATLRKDEEAIRVIRQWIETQQAK